MIFPISCPISNTGANWQRRLLASASPSLFFFSPPESPSPNHTPYTPFPRFLFPCPSLFVSFSFVRFTGRVIIPAHLQRPVGRSTRVPRSRRSGILTNSPVLLFSSPPTFAPRGGFPPLCFSLPAPVVAGRLTVPARGPCDTRGALTWTMLV